jgi:hypothetical protein
MRFVCECVPLVHARRLLQELVDNLDRFQPDLLKLALQRAVPEYQPQSSTQDLQIPRKTCFLQKNTAKSF